MSIQIMHKILRRQIICIANQNLNIANLSRESDLKECFCKNPTCTLTINGSFSIGLSSFSQVMLGVGFPVTGHFRLVEVLAGIAIRIDEPYLSSHLGAPSTDNRSILKHAYRQLTSIDAIQKTFNFIKHLKFLVHTLIILRKCVN